MKYAKVITPAREALVALEPSKWGAAYQMLFDQTDVSGYELWLAESSNNFGNVVAKSMEALYKQRGPFALILRDTAEEGGRGVDDKGRLDVIYVSHAGTEWQQEHKMRAPESGWYVPTGDDIFIEGKIWVPFYEGTLIPRETVQDKQDAIARMEAKGINPEWVSYFWRPDGYKEKRFVGRGFDPALLGAGRFGVLAHWLPSNSGYVGVASLPAYGKPEIVMEVGAPQTVKAK